MTGQHARWRMTVAGSIALVGAACSGAGGSGTDGGLASDAAHAALGDTGSDAAVSPDAMAPPGTGRVSGIDLAVAHGVTVVTGSVDGLAMFAFDPFAGALRLDRALALDATSTSVTVSSSGFLITTVSPHGAHATVLDATGQTGPASLIDTAPASEVETAVLSGDVFVAAMRDAAAVRIAISRDGLVWAPGETIRVAASDVALCTGGARLHAVVADTATGHALAMHSDDAGLTWATPVRVDPEGTDGTVTRVDCVATDGDVWALYSLGEPGALQAIRMVHSTRAGESFRVETLDAADVLPGASPSLIRDELGGLFVPFLAAGTPTGWSLRYARKGTRSFEESVELFAFPAPSPEPALRAVVSGSQLHVLDTAPGELTLRRVGILPGHAP